MITGAKWLRKDMETTCVNLVTGETGELPEGVSFDSARKSGNGWVVRFRGDWQEGEPMYQLFRNLCYDENGKEYEINMWSSIYGEADEGGIIDHFFDEFPLKNYPYEEVWLCPRFSHTWVAKDEIVVTIQ